MRGVKPRFGARAHALFVLSVMIAIAIVDEAGKRWM